jgi:hypothetical protein
MRAVLLEYAVAVILMMGLELAMRPWLDGLGKEYRRLTEKLASIRGAGESTKEQPKG